MGYLETNKSHSKEIEAWAAMYQFNHRADYDALYGIPNREQIAAERFYIECNHGARPVWGQNLEDYTVDAIGVYTFTPKP
jgi:hypothetical protein